MHRRKSSKDNVEQENVIVEHSNTQANPKHEASSLPNGHKGENGIAELPLKSRENRMPSAENDYSSARTPVSAGPYRTSFGSLAQSPNTPSRRSYAHSRTVSSSGAMSFASPMLSPPPSASFSRHSMLLGTHPPKLQASASESSAHPVHVPLQPSSPTTSRRHQRIHSRNLSVFFPRPGSLTASTIIEDGDGSQELDLPGISLNETEAPVSLIPPGPSIKLHNPPGPRRLGEGFTFGGRPERTISTSSTGSSSDGANSGVTENSQSKAKRRGHHHKHSMSHNFFSFLEPGAGLSPGSPSPDPSWHPMSPFPSSVASSIATPTHGHADNGTAVGLTSPNIDDLGFDRSRLPKDTIAVAIVQFLLGASLWVSGQQHGSLACTALGYWIVFDSFGVALRHVLPSYLSKPSTQAGLRRPYGNARVETLMLFAQTIYLIFSSVYVCKEAVEHLLLSMGDGHHHHPGDEESGVDGLQIPLMLTLLTMVSLVSTCLFYDNHNKLLATSGKNLPSFTRLIRFSRSYSHGSLSGTTPIHAILANPFTVAPLLLSSMLLFMVLFIPPSQQSPFDLLIALFEAVLTFKIAYPAAYVQGAVLLQTAPPRNLPGARMESFLRVMREIERHPLVLHLPAPHMWQLTPTTIGSNGSSSFSSSSLPSKSPSLKGDPVLVGVTLVVALELHVRRDTDDGELIVLTRWAHDRVRLALGGSDGADVTVGIVKG